MTLTAAFGLMFGLLWLAVAVSFTLDFAREVQKIWRRK